ncbi:MAG: 5-methyltetrahydropteroyltriglutamate--homocysteine S-methyltransferase [Rhodospirillales bacterium]|nr:5-methyltetrahydropteroyltriglutamate--homocysteine S-methyltransferase [Rhodospirillales bacterium]
MTVASNLGFPRIGHRRELKFALERHWSGELDEAGLLAEAARLRAGHWRLQQGLGISHVPSGDFSLYDAVLDMATMLGAVPPGYGWSGGPVPLSTYFALARGTRGTEAEGAAGVRAGLSALEMTKWFDTNYHYLVPRLAAEQRFQLTENRALALWREAVAAGTRTRPVLLGPVTFLLLAKAAHGSAPLDLLGRLLPIYVRILRELAEAGCAWVQMDEPCLACDLPKGAEEAFALAYAALAQGPAPDLLLASYFGPMGENLGTALRLPVRGLHLDLTRGASDLAGALAGMRGEQWLSLGLIDGRNVWRADLRAALAVAERVAAARGTERLMIAPSCSLLHVPVDLAGEKRLDLEVKAVLAFAVQKLGEVATLARGLDEGEAAVRAELEESDAAARTRRESARVHRPEVTARVAAITPAMQRRASPFCARRAGQQARLRLPRFPTTTIGSFPQTAEVRHARASLGRGALAATAYEQAIEGWIAGAVRWQEKIGLDLLVHGEFERNDMVRYFAEQLEGFAVTQHGWVQSYGSRCVAPPIIWGDIARKAPMTVRWAAYAQSLTERPVKGMLTGPVTMLQWSFVRDDRPRELVCRQIALALRDEIADLEAAGIAVIQVDEPALREGLPLRRAEWGGYLAWAVGCFRLATSGVRDETAIHTHMCYSEFNDIMGAVAAMDADAISIEAARSRMELLDVFAPGAGEAYPAEIGPGVWDIHSPRVPDADEMAELLALARRRLADWQIWVNPDCGLKTRRWEEVRPALENLVAAARRLRAEVAASA